MKSWLLWLAMSSGLIAASTAGAGETSAPVPPAATSAFVAAGAAPLAEISEPASAPAGAAVETEVAAGVEAPHEVAAPEVVSDAAPASGDVAAQAVADAEAWDFAAASEDSAIAAGDGIAVVESGAAGLDANGRPGSIHVVAKGDTLWAISDHYLDTPWVWPAIWSDNAEIANPHRIFPGDHIWISANEMRQVTPAEAAELVAEFARQEPAAAEEDLAAPDGAPAAMEFTDTLAVTPEPTRVLRTLAISARSNMGFLSAGALDAASSIVESSSPRIWLSEGDSVVLGLGEGETEIGDRYDVIDDAEPVRDEATGMLHGYHVEVLGWLEVTAVHGDSSSAVVRTSIAGMLRGARIVAREPLPVELALLEAPRDLDAKIIFAPANRTQMVMLDYVYLNRGSVHGLEEGSVVEVFESGGLARDAVRGARVRTPDRNIADLVIVRAQPASSVGFIVHSHRELVVGDRVRAPGSAVSMR